MEILFGEGKQRIIRRVRPDEDNLQKLYEATKGKWAIGWSDCEYLKNPRQAARSKDFVDLTNFDARVSYGDDLDEYRHLCHHVLFGNANQEGFICAMDEEWRRPMCQTLAPHDRDTSNPIDTEWLRQNRDQLWAEMLCLPVSADDETPRWQARDIVLQGEQDIANRRNNLRYVVHDEMVDLVDLMFQERNGYVRKARLVQRAKGLMDISWTMPERERLYGAMKSKGFAEKTVNSNRAWVRGPKPYANLQNLLS